MANNVLIIYHSTDGHTIKICDKIGAVLTENQHNVQIIEANKFDQSLASYDQVIVAASIRYGKHNQVILDFIENNCLALEQKDNAFISVNLVARKEEKSTASTNPYVRKFLEGIRWTPKKTYVFAGNLDYPKYSFFDRIMIQLIMLITGGPTDPKTQIEYTDWTKVEACAHELCQAIDCQREPEMID